MIIAFFVCAGVFVGIGVAEETYELNMACLAYNVIHLRNLICGTKKQKKQSKAIKNSWGIAKNLQDLFAFF